MPLASSGALTLEQIRAEFAVPLNAVFPTQFYRGGTYVPNTPVNAAIPTSGTMLIPNNFYGASGYKVSLPSTYAVYSGDSTFVTAGIYFESDGDFAASEALGGYYDAGDWAYPKTAAPGSYEIRATLLTGAVSTGTIDSWQALTSTRSWTRTRSAIGVSTCELLFEIRLGSTVQATGTFSLTAERFESGGPLEP